mmetsp:Transcript_21733/g.64081  ORF Transcript_21733/g.64081 Transcript_21733/m.64081 type:complete len:362 (+) Transcript_21733:72-1157(+)
MYDAIFRAAARGDVDKVRAIIDHAEANGVDIADAVDEVGRSACFYAQMTGGEEVTQLLLSRGWTAMDESNFFLNSAGRLCFWNEPRLPRKHRVPTAAARTVVPAFRSDRGDSERPKAPSPKESARKSKVKERRLQRQLERPSPGYRRNHPLYPRKEAEETRPRPCLLPELETNDVLEPDVMAVHNLGARLAVARRLRPGIASILTHRVRDVPALAADADPLATNVDCASPGDTNADRPALRVLSASGVRANDAGTFSLAAQDWPALPAKGAKDCGDIGGIQSKKLRNGWIMLTTDAPGKGLTSAAPGEGASAAGCARDGAAARRQHEGPCHQQDRPSLLDDADWEHIDSSTLPMAPAVWSS